MDSNKNKECCYSNGGGGLTVVIGTDCIAKAVSAAKYQNQFNNNNLIEQENLMPPVHDRVSGMVQDDSSPSTLPQQNGVASNESPVKDKVLAENGSSRHFASVFNQSSSSVSAGSETPSERLLPNLQSSVNFFITGTNNVTNFNPTTNGTGADHLRAPGQGSNGYVPPTVDPASNGTEEPHDNVSSQVDAEVPKFNAREDSSPPDEGDFSDNNSLGNLSYVSENGLIEEIILLPNNAYSDDDNASTSDDCIYAYRGGEPDGAAGQLLDLQGDLPPDDETDFLEMDFDPEPSSEMENFNRQSDFMLGLDNDKFAGVARAADGQDNAGNGPRLSPIVARSPTVPQHNLIHQESGPFPMENEATSQKGNETGLHRVPESNDTRSQLSAPVQTLASLVEESKAVATVHDQRELNVGAMDSFVPSVNRLEAQKTGAIPKNVPILMERSTPTEREGLPNSKNLRLELSLQTDDSGLVDTSHRYQQCSPFYYKSAEFGVSKRSKGVLEASGDEETHCLDCAEQEFLMRTKQDPTRQRFCNVCNATKQEAKGRSLANGAVRSYARDSTGRVEPQGFFSQGSDRELPKEDDETAVDELLDLRAEQIVYDTLHKINTLKEMPPTGGQARVNRYQSKGNVPKVSEQHEAAKTNIGWYDQQVPRVGTKKMQEEEQSVTIYTFNCSLLTIMESLTCFGLTPNQEVLRQYFYDQYEVDTSKMTIPQYLLHMSKRDCNYKKLIDAIKSSCDDELLDIQYYPLHPFSDMPETVEICSSEIAKRWTANTNLRQIIHFKHKHFHTLNVLGKIVNILRQPSRGRHTNHMISIPQYYKSGIIKIRRIGVWSAD
ncbi:uncharacterized protein LOC128712451 [Anopheles marshallii]|uniref:uncharacterized protein LOC128712451 n=1 Tax=Anopheles marshallii TaxID=1521116 RepID=UPI00237C2D5D|nr:uncharacterized protein LOC128712451 [Anopheles marshallii]